MKTIRIIFCVLFVFVAMGCAKKEKQMIANLQEHISNLEEQVKAKESGAQQILADLEKTTMKSDSLQKAVDTLTVIVAAGDSALRFSLDSAFYECQLLQARLEGCVTVNQKTAADLASYVAKADSLEGVLTASVEEAKRQMHISDSLAAHLDNTRQWRDYYKSESRRGWLKELAGTERAKKPVVPEVY